MFVYIYNIYLVCKRTQKNVVVVGRFSVIPIEVHFYGFLLFSIIIFLHITK